MTMEKALQDLLREVSPQEYLDLLRLLNNAYLETVDGGVDMDVIYRIQRLEDLFFMISLNGCEHLD
ncbi:MAG: hypothetical protein F6K19_17350 [Cyanothece sp. SIO1E1]|nr:hypothetical protein [Cyanothece sp. SIO1E1]